MHIWKKNQIQKRSRKAHGFAAPLTRSGNGANFDLKSCVLADKPVEQMKPSQGKAKIVRSFGLYTDMYELTMGQAYFENGTADVPACFDYFFRSNPFGGGYVIFAGLRDVLEALTEFRFGPEELEYLQSLNLSPGFVDHLRSFRFRGDVYSVREGEVVFPLEPVFRVEGTLLETQLVETALLNFLNFESLIATKASRIRLAAGDKILSDFGLRRAHGLGGIQASRAAMIGGFDSTSNVYSAFRYGLPPSGTMAHSYIESHNDELTAFRQYADAHPQNSIFLVDTYDTLKSGIPNAITVAKEMAAKGRKLLGIRLDSGDLAYLSTKAREALDEAGLPEVKIVVSNLLDEHLIKSLLDQGAPIDIFGVGTKLVTGVPDAALDGIYKLAEAGGRPRLKLSESISKITLPGRKTVLRCAKDEGFFEADAVALEGEDDIPRIVHPFEPEKALDIAPFRKERLFRKVMEKGEILQEEESIAGIARYARERLARLPAEHKRFENPHVYKVGLSERLMHLRDELVHRYRKEE
jgi:nicotinate phosphoribosyltransferase